MVLTGVVVIGLSRSTEGDDLFRWSPNSEISATDETRPRAAAGKEQAGAASDAAGEPTTTRPRDPDSRAAAGTSTASRNTNVDMEDLLFKELPAPVVSSATKIEQPIYEAPSAITVITAEDIRRMGARRLVDVFRWTPGLDVFAISGNSSSVSARGVYSLHNRFVNEMLVLIDGRSVYVDFLGGVDWDTLPVLIEEIERIEIIRGPSGSLYGPNAFAGTVSIFTKRTPELTVLQTTVGNKHHFENNLVHWLEGDHYQLRLGIGWLENEGFGAGNGRGLRDDLNFLKMNLFGRLVLDCQTDLEFRGGWVTGSRSFEAAGDTAAGREDTDVPYGQVQFQHRFSDDARFRAQYFHNHFNFDKVFLNGARGLETWTDVITLEQYWQIHPSHQLISGGEFRNFVAHSGITDPGRIEENFRSLYVEDAITLIEEKLRFTGGLRYDDFSVSGDDFSPRAAIVWTPQPQHSFRASIARSVATPMTVAGIFDFTVPIGTVNVGPPFGLVPILSQTIGNPSLNPESIVAYELGYRGRWSKDLDVGLDLFLYDVTDLMRLRPGVPTFDPTVPAVIIANTFGNDVNSLAYGGELSVVCRWSECLSTFAGYSYKELPGVTNMGVFNGLENFKNSLFAGWDWQLACNWTFSGRMAWNDGFAVGNLAIDDYTRLDLRLARSIWNRLGTVELIGQNLLDRRHPESDFGIEIERTVYFALKLAL